MAELRQLMGAGRPMEALELAQRRLNACRSRRELLLWRLSLSRTLLDAGRSRLALPYLEQVLDDIAGHRLEEYEPELALQGYRLAWLALDGQTETRFKERALEVLLRIGRIDLPEMARLSPG